jgi:hypothetical protein
VSEARQDLQALCFERAIVELGVGPACAAAR